MTQTPEQKMTDFLAVVRSLPRREPAVAIETFEMRDFLVYSAMGLQTLVDLAGEEAADDRFARVWDECLLALPTIHQDIVVGTIRMEGYKLPSEVVKEYK